MVVYIYIYIQVKYVVDYQMGKVKLLISNTSIVNIMENGEMELKMDLVLNIILMEILSIQENGKIICIMDLEYYTLIIIFIYNKNLILIS